MENAVIPGGVSITTPENPRAGFSRSFMQPTSDVMSPRYGNFPIH